VGAGDDRGRGALGLPRLAKGTRGPAEVRLGLEGFGHKSATYRYEIVLVETGRLVAAAKTIQVWYDYDASRSVPLTDATKSLLSNPVK